MLLPIIFTIFSKNSYNLEKMRDLLEYDNSSINERNLGRTPLIKVLKNSKCSIDIVRLLLQYGADVNVKDVFGNTALLTAFENFRDETIIEALLEKGANIEDQDCYERTPFRYTFSNWNKSTGNFKWKENVLNLLLEAGLDLNKVSASGRSPLCYALSQGEDVRDIELLLSKGASLTACQRHATPLHCITGSIPFISETLLKASVVQLLLDKQAPEWKVSEMDLKPLQNALRFCQYETAAIRLLFEYLDGNAVNTWIQQTSDVLHLVVNNSNCKTSIVKLFLKQGACIDALNDLGETALLRAVIRRHNPSVIKFLLKSGAPVNVKSIFGKTPLKLAILQGMGNYVINLLFAFGARFSVSCDQNEGISFLKEFLEYNQNKKSDFKTLLKYYFLEFPDFNIQSMIKDHSDYESLSVFAVKCANELQRMGSKKVRSNCTLRRFISENFLLDIKTNQEVKVASHSCNQILKILSNNEFPEYYDVIASKFLASKVGEVFLKKNLHELIMYTVDHCPVKACLIKKVVLNNDCVRKLAVFLSDEELLYLVVAFYHSDNPTYNDNTSKKRNLDTQKFHKIKKRTKQ